MPVPPVADSTVEYGCDWLALGSALVAMTTSGSTWMVKVRVRFLPELATRMSKVEVPAVVGVPLRTPLLASAMPGGSVPFAQGPGLASCDRRRWRLEGVGVGER
ncbi:MAG: hypothetical protein U5L05_18095 [Rubrivivax sp.]|nr:hypothetical protein [Rubrivivax sp.]